MLLWDGAAEGGSRGGYWTNARKAFEGAAIGRFQPGNHKFEAFFLDKDDLPEADSSTKLWGVNYEYLIGEDTTLGATYLKLSANDTAPQRDGLNVYDFRVFTAPFDSMKGLSFEAEYAHRRQRQRARFDRVQRARRVSAGQRSLETEVFLPLCDLRRR